MIYRNTAIAALSVLTAATLAACGSGPQPSSIGFHAFTRAPEATMLDACDSFLGSPEDLGKRLNLTLYPEPSSSGSCAYETSSGGSVTFLVSDQQPRDATLYARGETYYVAVVTESADVTAAMLGERRENLTTWLTARAEAVTDDYQTWLEGLPSVDDNFVATSDFTLESSADATETVDSTLTTPVGTVHVSSVSSPPFLLVNGTASAAGEGRRFVVADINIAHEQNVQVAPDYSLEINGSPVGGAERALAELASSSASVVALTVPSDAEEITFVVDVGGTKQAISLLTGEVLDDGESNRLAYRASGRASSQITLPDITRAAGGTRKLYGTFVAYERSVEVELSPWTADEGWAPEGQVFATLAVIPSQPELVAPLTASDATITVNGIAHDALGFDPATYTFRFVLPEGAVRLDAQVRFTLSPQQVGLREGESFTGPVQLDIPIDPNHLGSESAEW